MTRIEASHARTLLSHTSLLAVLMLSASPAFGGAGATVQDSVDASPARAAFVGGQDSRIVSHPYLSKIVLERFSPDEDFVFLVQKDPAAIAGAAEALAKKHVEWMEVVEARFLEQVVIPGDLQRSRGGAPHVVIVLTSDGDYRNYLNQAKHACGSYSGANYDPFLSATVLYKNTFSKQGTAIARHADQRHAFVHSLEQAYGTVGFRHPGPEWLAEGLAVLGALDDWNAKAPETGRVLPQRILAALVQLERGAQHRKGGLRLIRDLLKHEKRPAFRKQIGGSPARFWQTASSLAMECGAFVFFLSEANGGQRRAALQEFSAEAFADHGGGVVAAKTAFGDLNQLDKEFWAYIHSEYKKVNSTHVVTVRGAPRSRVVAAPVETVVKKIEPRFDPTTLALGLDDMDARFGLALLDASQGRLKAAAEQLDAIATEYDDVRARREHGRAVALMDARDRFIAHLVVTQGTLRAKLDGDKFSAGISAVDGRILKLGKNRRGLDELAVDRISVVDWALAMSKEDVEFATPLTLAYAYGLVEDDRFKKKLRRAEDTDDLKRDAASYGSHIAVGVLAEHVRCCAEMPAELLDVTGAEAVILAVSELSPYISELPFLTGRRDGLRKAAGIAQEVVVEALPIEELLRGRVEHLGEGRLRVTYDFEDESELQDFVRDDKYHAERRKLWVDIGDAANESDCTIEDGELVSTGAVGLRLPLVFKGPQKLVYDVRWANQGHVGPRPAITLLAALCDDGAGSMVSNWNFGGLEVRDAPTRYFVDNSVNAANSCIWGQVYEFVLDHDGTQVAWSLDGDQQNVVAAGPRVEGEVIFVLHSSGPHLALGRVSMEGQLAEGGTSRLRSLRVEELLDGLFPGAGN